MQSTEKTYQPGWSEKKKHHHHHHAYQAEKENNRRLGGALRMRDKQAYYGLMVALIGVALIGVFALTKYIVKEIRELPLGDPTTEMEVDVLHIDKIGEHDALLAADSLAQSYQFDSSMIHRVQIETQPVYRRKRPNDQWYLSGREWKDILENFKRWKKSNQ